MVAYNFKPQFAADVKSGKKLRTLRQKQRAKVGDALQLYTGMMHKNCRKLRDATCTRVAKIVLYETHLYEDELLRVESADDFAREDGFIDYEAMVLFFKKTYPKKEWPITLHLTEWNPLP